MTITTTFILLLLWQVPPGITPADVEKLAKADLQSIVVYLAYAIYATLFVILCAVAGWGLSQQKLVREQHKEFTQRQEKVTEMLLEFTRTMGDHVKVLDRIPELVIKHERDSQQSRDRTEESIKDLLTEIKEVLKQSSHSRQR